MGRGWGWAKGKTFEELYGMARAAEVRKSISDGRKNSNRQFGRPKRKSLDLIIAQQQGKMSTSGFIKRRLIGDEILENECARCLIPAEWNSEKLVLQLDHKDGDRTNWSLENLRLLCPNCHSQTPTFTGRNRKV